MKLEIKVKVEGINTKDFWEAIVHFILLTVGLDDTDVEKCVSITDNEGVAILNERGLRKLISFLTSLPDSYVYYPTAHYAESELMLKDLEHL